MKDESSPLKVKRTQKRKLVTTLCLLCQKVGGKRLVNPTDAGREKVQESLSKRQSCCGHTYSEFIQR